MWALTLKNDPKLIGTICFWNIKKEDFRAETGFVILNEYQGRGLMQEALTAVLEYGFKIMKLHSIEAVISPKNIASTKLIEKCGFVKEAHFKENYFFDGRFSDTVVYSLVAPID